MAKFFVLHFDPALNSMWCQWSVRNPYMNLVQVWILYYNPNFKYCTLFFNRIELRTDRQIDRQSNKWTDRQTENPMPPADLSDGGHKNWLMMRATYGMLYLKTNCTQDCKAISVRQIHWTVRPAGQICDQSDLPYFWPDWNVRCCFQYYVYYVYSESDRYKFGPMKWFS